MWLGGFLQARKDDARWLRERDRENERWAREDAARWLREQHELYAAAISAVERLRQVSRNAFHPHPSAAGGLPDEVVVALRETIPGLTVSAQNALEAIGVLGAQEIYHPGAEAIFALQVMASDLRSRDPDSLIQAYSEASEATNKMRAAIRVELGVGGPSPRTGSAFTG